MVVLLFITTALFTPRLQRKFENAESSQGPALVGQGACGAPGTEPGRAPVPPSPRGKAQAESPVGVWMSPAALCLFTIPFPRLLQVCAAGWEVHSSQ